MSCPSLEKICGFFAKFLRIGMFSRCQPLAKSDIARRFPWRNLYNFRFNARVMPLGKGEDSRGDAEARREGGLRVFAPLRDTSQGTAGLRDGFRGARDGSLSDLWFPRTLRFPKESFIRHIRVIGSPILTGGRSGKPTTPQVAQRKCHPGSLSLATGNSFASIRGDQPQPAPRGPLPRSL